MRTELAFRAVKTTKITRSEFRADEESFEATLADVARLLWPAKTAAHIAGAIGCTERNAEFQLAGKQKWSGDAVAAIVAEVLRRRKMRNVKITRRWDD